MQQTYNKRSKFKQLFIISIPILVTQLALFAMTFFDTTMSGNASSTDLAGVAIGSSLWVPVYTGMNGILLAITPIVSQALGSKDTKKIRSFVSQGIYLSILLGVLAIILGSFAVKPILNTMSLEDDVRYIAQQYLVALSIGIIPLFVSNVLRSFIDALGKTKVTMIITLSSLPINIVLNYVLIFGKLGFPKLGGIGTGFATAITYWFILLVTIFIVLKVRTFNVFKVFTFTAISLRKWKEILVIGVPIGLSIFIEVSIFSVVTLLMSQYDTITIAAHQTAMNFSSFLYMVPLSLSMAITIVVGYEVGANRFRDAKTYSWIGITMALSMAIVTCSILLLFREQVARLYSEDARVIEMATDFLLFALGFQFFDALLAPIQGSLRGYKDVNITFVATLVAFWVIGLPLGIYLNSIETIGPFGYWIGLITGLGSGAFFLIFRLIYRQRKTLKEITAH
ncbi:MAG: MATE family efflux transporter [Bacillaceae bacterium]